MIRIGIVVASLILLGCSASKEIAVTPNVEAPMEVRNLDTLVITASPLDADVASSIPDTLPVYRSSHRRTVDLLHTDLDLRFDWDRQQVIGSAVLRLVAYNLPVDEVTLDAKNFKWNSVVDGHSKRDLQYQADKSKIVVSLEQTLGDGDTLLLALDYIASPAIGVSSSAAITSDQGLFFINPDGNEASKPQQIWTQGETEFNSNWFPTVDKPNERQTHTIALTVADRFTTLSNGMLTSSESVGNGMRRDVWVMDQPHAPYLVMLGIGEFAVIEESADVPVAYYVEKDFAQDAAAIFNHTPEMISFFAKLTGTPYPWQKYSQIVVRDYVSGAMENTTAVIYGEQVQRHRRELIDDHNDYIVAHELIHHWFGNLVTCESWSNLTLNEGFANYGEYLWFEHKYGKDYAEHHRLEQLEEYLFEAETKRHALIDFHYSDKEDMFDAHSYNKGGLVLHMLRDYLGDELFFESWKQYLMDNAYQSVEMHHLRLAVEKTCGEDMSWFFNQWFLSSGHPELRYNHLWSGETNTLTVQVDQIQDVEENLPIYRIPSTLLVTFQDGSSQLVPLVLDERSQEFLLQLTSAPLSVILDPEHMTLADIHHGLEVSEAQQLYSQDAPYALRNDIVERLAGQEDEASLAVLTEAMADSFWEIRRKSINYVNWEEPGTPVGVLRTMAEQDAHSQVRADALMILALIAPNTSKELLSQSINDTDPYPVVGSAISGLFQIDPDACLDKLNLLKSEKQPDIVAAISGIYRQIGAIENLSYFDEHMATTSGVQALSFFGNLQALVVKLPIEDMVSWLQKCTNVATNKSVNPYGRIGATRTLIAFMKQSDQIDGLDKEIVSSLVDEVMSAETNDQILSIYESMIGS